MYLTGVELAGMPRGGVSVRQDETSVSVFPSPNATLGDGDGAARRPYRTFLPTA
jgi:hypothetical protein